MKVYWLKNKDKIIWWKDCNEKVFQFCKDNDLKYEWNKQGKSVTIVDIFEKKHDLIVDFIKQNFGIEPKITKRSNEVAAKQEFEALIGLNELKPMHSMLTSEELEVKKKEIYNKYKV